MKSNKKIYIGILLFLVLFFLFMFFLFGRDYLKQEKESFSIIIGNDTLWSYQNNQLTNRMNYSSIEKYNNQEYFVFLSDQKFHNLVLSHDDSWKAFENNKGEVSLTDDFFAYQSSFDLSLTSVSIQKINKMKYVRQVLESNGISSNSEFSSSYMFSFDIDQDGGLEDFYSVSNAFLIGSKADKVFTFFFMVKDNKIFYVYRDVDQYNSYSGCKPYVSFFLDINHDSNYEFIFNCGRYSKETPIRRIYRFQNQQFEILVSNE